MTNVVIVVEQGIVKQVYSRNKNVEIELLDLDTNYETTYKNIKDRIKKIEDSKSYKPLL